MRLLKRLMQRLLILGLGIFSVWLIVFVVFKIADRRLPWMLALGITYGLAAYIILPRAIRLGLKILQREHVPSYTITGDGLPGDPVNLALIGTLQQLRAAFAGLGWCEADRLSLASSWGMIRAFVFNSPYPTAPFSTLYLFGRGQDVGFQKAIDNSPRKRHHIRFWALNLTRAQDAWRAGGFWLNNERPPDNERVLWVGAGTRDTGLSFTRLTFQITHATDSDTNAERDYIIAELTKNRTIEAVQVYQSGQDLLAGRVNHYVTDGEVALASLVTNDDLMDELRPRIDHEIARRLESWAVNSKAGNPIYSARSSFAAGCWSAPLKAKPRGSQALYLFVGRLDLLVELLDPRAVGRIVAAQLIEYAFDREFVDFSHPRPLCALKNRLPSKARPRTSFGAGSPDRCTGSCRISSAI